MFLELFGNSKNAFSAFFTRERSLPNQFRVPPLSPMRYLKATADPSLLPQRMPSGFPGGDCPQTAPRSPLLPPALPPPLPPPLRPSLLVPVSPVLDPLATARPPQVAADVPAPMREGIPRIKLGCLAPLRDYECADAAAFFFYVGQVLVQRSRFVALVGHNS